MCRGRTRNRNTVRVLQERARFRRNYPPLTGSNDPHYQWRAEKQEDRHVDDILSRLIEVRVGPVEQAAQCACAVKRPPADSSQSYSSANNAVDTRLPYNPWYGSHTEHRLNAMSIDDVDHVQIIRPVTTALARPRVHVEEEWNNDERLGRLSTTEMAALSACDETTLNDLVQRNLNVCTSSDELDRNDDSIVADGAAEQASPLQQPAPTTEAVSIATSLGSETVTPPQESATTDKVVAPTEEISESMTAVEKPVEEIDNGSRVTGESSKPEHQPQSAGYPVSVDQMALPKTPGLETTRKYESDKVLLKPKNSASSDEATEASLSTAVSGHQLGVNCGPQQHTQPTTVAGELNGSNYQQDPNKQGDVSENPRSLEESDERKEFDHASTPTDQRKSRFLLCCVKDGPTEPPQRENTQQNESETKLQPTEPDYSATAAPLPRPRTSLNKIPSTPPVPTDNDEDGRHISTEPGGKSRENVEHVDAGKSSSGVELRLRLTESVTDLGEVQEMDVDERDAEEHDAEATDEDVEMTSERRSEEKLTNGADELQINSEHHHQHHQQHQQQQQQSLEIQPAEINTERTTSKESQRTVSTAGPVTVAADGLDISSLPTAAASVQEETHPHHHHDIQQQQQSVSIGTSKEDQRTISTSDRTAVVGDLDNTTAAIPVPSTAQNTSVSSDQNVEESSDQIPATKTSSDNPSLSREKDTTKGHAESVPLKSSNGDSKHALGDDDDNVEASKFPKSSTGHETSQQQDRRVERLTKSVRVYHDLSTVIDYQEDENKAVTTIRLKSAKKQ